MQGTWNNGRPHHRCQFAAEYALTTTCAAMATAQHPDETIARADAARAKIADCD